MKRLSICLALVACAGSNNDHKAGGAWHVDATDPGVVSDSDALGTARGKVIDEISRELHAMRSTVYTHTTSVDESTGQFDFDCSGFLGYALDHADPNALAKLRAGTQERPLAEDFYSYFAVHGSGFTSVSRAIDLRPGDMIAWLKPSDVGGNNTGHAMFVRAPVKVSSADAHEVLVPIADATSTPHGHSDSRYADGSTGLGTGVIGLMVDDNGAPHAYRWSGGESKKIEETSIALARVD